MIDSIIKDSVSYYPELVITKICDESNYEYGFNGPMKVNEWAGNGNHNTALFWEYDTRVVKRQNLDPKGNVWESGYAVFGNNPILYSDVLGDKFTNKNTELKNEALIKKNEAEKAVLEAQKNLEDLKQKNTATKKEVKSLEKLLNIAINKKNDCENEYNLQVAYEEMTNNVINEFQKVNPTEFDKWNKFKYAG